MDQDTIDCLIAAIEELERLFAQAKDDPASLAWREMQEKLGAVQEQVDRLRPH